MSLLYCQVFLTMAACRSKADPSLRVLELEEGNKVNERKIFMLEAAAQDRN